MPRGGGDVLPRGGCPGSRADAPEELRGSGAAGGAEDLGSAAVGGSEGDGGKEGRGSGSGETRLLGG